MCGLLGYLTTKPTEEHRRIVSDLFLATENRGRDATGYATVQNGIITYAKKGVDATAFLKSGNLSTEVLPTMPHLLTGHCRQGTTGEAKDNVNNHPIVTKSGFAITHNGIIATHIYNGVKEKYKLQCDGEVDSEIIVRLIEKFALHAKGELSKERIAQCIASSCKKICGSYTYALVHKNFPRTLFLVKHDNPLYLAYAPDLETIFYASSEGILKYPFDLYTLVLNFFPIRTKSEHKLLTQVVQDDSLVIVDIGEDGKFHIDSKKVECKEWETLYQTTYKYCKRCGYSHVAGWHRTTVDNKPIVVNGTALTHKEYAQMCRGFDGYD